MQDKKKAEHTERDSFDKLVSSRLKEHRMPVSADRWAMIEKEIQPKRKLIKWWYPVSAAVAIGLLVWFIFPLKETDRLDMAAETATPLYTDSIAKEKPSKDWLAEESTTKKEQKHPANTPKSATQSSKKLPPIQTTPEKEDAIDSSKAADSQATPVATKEASDKQPEKPQEKPIKQQATEVGPEINRTSLFAENKRLPSEKKATGGWSVGVHAGTGGNISFDGWGGDLSYDAAGPGDEQSGGNNTGYENVNNPWDFDHKLPLSIGFMLRKEFSSFFSVETGLSYTYLSSNMSRSARKDQNTYVTQKGTQQLHYLGIPINAIGKLWGNKQWSVYLSAGGMVEKGLGMKQTIRSYAGSEKIMTENINKQWLKGVQWSLNGSVGVSFNLTPAWSIYLEPRISYYFDNDQPFSIRTEKSTLFNLTGGVRLNL